MKSPQILFVFHLLFLVLYMHTPLGIFLKKSLFRGALREQNIGFAVFECLCFWYFLTNLQGTVKAASRPDFHGGEKCDLTFPLGCEEARVLARWPVNYAGILIQQHSRAVEWKS